MYSYLSIFLIMFEMPPSLVSQKLHLNKYDVLANKRSDKGSSNQAKSLTQTQKSLIQHKSKKNKKIK